MKKTIVLGASTNPARYAHTAVKWLSNKGHEVIALGKQEGTIHGVEILKDKPLVEGVDTVTLYLNPDLQKAYYDYILALNPKRLIFNPGTENAELARLAREKGIQVEFACTLTMLSVGNY